MKAEGVARELEWTGGLMPPRWKTAEAKAIRTLIAERDDLQRALDLSWAAQMRAIAAWQERHDEPLTWPDHERLVIWLMEERDALLEERQRFETRLFDMAEAGDQARTERDALRVLLAAARGYMLGAGDGYENEVILAIDAALKETKP